jgi:peptide/nickel transport system permease protein
VQGFVLAMALLYLFLNLVIDVTAGLLDPKVRFDV